MQFMNSSLKKLVLNLSGDNFKYLTKEFESKYLELLKQKDAYPYEYMNSFKRFSEEKLDGHISAEDYLRCKKIWNKFNVKNIGDYQDHYLKKHVLLLADVFEKFIDTCLKFYKLDSCH